MPGASASGGYWRFPSVAPAVFSRPERAISHSVQGRHHDPLSTAAIRALQRPYLNEELLAVYAVGVSGPVGFAEHELLDLSR